MSSLQRFHRNTRDSRATAYILVASTLAAAALAGAFAWVYRDMSLAGFFLAVGIAAGAMAALVWPK